MHKLQAELEGFPEAIKSLKRSLHILKATESELASAAISIKLVDVLDSIVSCKFLEALSEIWQCSYVIQHVLYSSISESTKINSNRMVAAECAAKDGDFRLATEQCFKANHEITVNTGLQALFLEPK